MFSKCYAHRLSLAVEVQLNILTYLLINQRSRQIKFQTYDGDIWLKQICFAKQDMNI